MQTNLRIRSIQQDDAVSLSQLQAATDLTSWSCEQWRQGLMHREFGWVLCREDQLIGYILLSRQPDDIELLTIGIDKPYQGQGLGGCLLDYAVSALLVEGVRILLEVRASNYAAIRLYESRGFTTISQRKGYYRAADGSRESANLMQLICTINV